MRRPAVAALIGVFIAIVIAALGYFLLIGPKNGTLDKKQKEIEAIDVKIQTEKNTNKQLTDIKNNSAVYEARLASLNARIPAEPELPQLIRTIQAAADPGTGAGLPWLSFTPGDVTGGATTTGQAASSVSSYTFKMSVSGFYDDVVDLIYRMERFPRAVVVDSVSMAITTDILTIAYSPNLGLVKADITAKTFTFAQPVSSAGTSQPSSSTPQPSSTPRPQASTTPSG